MTGCTIDTLTLSIEQKLLAEARIAAAGLTSSITVHLLDYRSLPDSFTHAFDRVVSIEMIEAVGKEFLGTYFETLDKVLKKDRGLAVVQVITMPESRFENYGKSVDFIQKVRFFPVFSKSLAWGVDVFRHRAAHLPWWIPPLRYVPRQLHQLRLQRPSPDRRNREHRTPCVSLFVCPTTPYLPTNLNLLRRLRPYTEGMEETV